jgi:hypothetical protein
VSRSRAVGLVLVLAIAVTVVMPSTVGASAGRGADPTAAGRRYLHALFGGTRDPSKLVDALRFAEVGSDAYAYVEY